MALGHLKVYQHVSSLRVVTQDALLLVALLLAVFTVPHFDVVNLLLGHVAEIGSALRMHPATVHALTFS